MLSTEFVIVFKTVLTIKDTKYDKKFLPWAYLYYLLFCYLEQLVLDSLVFDSSLRMLYVHK
jgi:hypothetical protein